MTVSAQEGTVEIAAACVAKHRALGFDISHVHRANRSGFKAGALEEGLAEADLGRHGVHQVTGLPGRAHRLGQQPHRRSVTALFEAYGAEPVAGLSPPGLRQRHVPNSIGLHSPYRP